MVPMKCQRCSSSAIRVTATNNRDDATTVRQRLCSDCGHGWFTVEVVVKEALVGWTARGQGVQSKPVLRVPVAMAIGDGAV